MIFQILTGGTKEDYTNGQALGAKIRERILKALRLLYCQLVPFI